MPASLRFEEEELLRSHDYARPQIEAGRRLHGGFLPNGRYVPPRTAVRRPALEAWTRALRARGGDLLAANASLLGGIRYPNAAQLKLLLQEGLGQTFWNTLTITGHIEARGRILADLPFPDFQEVIEEDITEMAVGHLRRGLLRAHGLDEGGEPELGIGGHDVMWFALRDLAFGEVGYPEPAIPATIGRPEAEQELPPELPEAHARALSFLLNLLMIEFRAELGFQLTETLLRDPELFRERREQASRAATLVARIRQDEEIHVHSLRLVLGELRALHLRTPSGERVPAAGAVDALWSGIVQWATVEQPRLAAEQQRKLIENRILAHPEGPRILERFRALEEEAA